MDVICRFYEPTTGQVLIDGVDLPRAQPALESNLGMVLQNAHVFSGSIRENIRCGQLSAGQKQLVSFARAILAEPQILVMDEATSSVDTETELKIQQGLKFVLQGGISFVIAHRLSTIRNATRVVVIDEGRIVETGDHAELIARNGHYAALYRQQSLDEATRGWGEGSAGAEAVESA